MPVNSDNGSAQTQVGQTSVVIPCYRDDRFLHEALESVRRQTRPVREVIVIDDGSPEALVPPGDWDDPPLVWVRTANQGLGAARNEGLKRAEGCFVAFLDADDHWEPEKIERQEALLDANADAVACYTHCVTADGYFGFGPYPTSDLDRDCLAVKLWYGQFFPPSSVLMRRSAAEAVGGFRVGLRNGEDLDMWFRLFDQGEFLGVDQPLTWYRVHDGQITSDDVRRVMGSKEARREIIEKHADRLVRGGVPRGRLWDAYRSEILGVYFRRRFEAARPMLWDYWKEHPADMRVAVYLAVSLLPASWVRKLRGAIGEAMG